MKVFKSKRGAKKRKYALKAQVSKYNRIDQLVGHHDPQVGSSVDLEEHTESG